MIDQYIIYLIAFVIFIVAVYRPVSKIVTENLDEHAAKVKARIQEAKELRVQAQEKLSFYEVQQRDSSQQIDQITADAQREAEILKQQALDSLLKDNKRHQKKLSEKLETMEANAIEQYRQMVIRHAVEATETMLERYRSDNTNIVQQVESALKQFPAQQL